MAKSKTLFSTFFIPLTLTFLFFSLVTATYHESISPASLGFKEEKLTHLHFFFHDVVSGPNSTVVFVAEPLKGKTNDALPFGTVLMMDDPLTEGSDPDSKPVGKAQGLYASISKEEMGLIMVMTLAFTEGKYKDSTLSVLARNMVLLPVREMAIVGGTGAFRFARGYAQATFHSVDFTEGNAIVEYNIYVFHY